MFLLGCQLKKGFLRGQSWAPFFNVFMNDLFYFEDGVSCNTYADDEQVYDSDKDPVRLEARLLLKADHWFGMNGMISNPYKYQAMVLGNTNHAFSFHAKSIKIPALIS